MPNLSTISCDVKQQEPTRIFRTHTKENFDYYTKRFQNLPSVKVVYEKRTPEEECEIFFATLKAMCEDEAEICR